MLYVSILVELIRSRPALAVWIAALMQGLLWTFVPAWSYWGPPGDVPFVLAAGHEFQFGGYLAPPLSAWLAEIAFRATGGGLFGIYALAQACVIVTYGAVFSLARSIVGAQQAALAVLLMVGVSAFSVPTPDFGPMVLTMPLWALVLLFYWRAVVEGQRRYWIALGASIGLLVLTSYLGIVLLVILGAFTVANPHTRIVLATFEPWVAALVAALCLLPHMWWLQRSGQALPSVLGVAAGSTFLGNLVSGLRLFVGILVSHVGMLFLVALVFGWSWTRHDPGPVIVRPPVSTFARQFVYVFALAPALAATLFGLLTGASGQVAVIAPLVILSGLALIVIAGDAVELAHQHVVIAAWFGLLLLPPAMAASAFLILPWFDINLAVFQPAEPMAQFFADNFQRRVGAPLPIVAGDPHTAALVALAPSRPHLLLDFPERSPWVTFADVRANGAIVVWPTTDTAGTPPPSIAARFRGLVPEVPRVFALPVQGRLPLVRIGWAVVRPQTDGGAEQPADKTPDAAPGTATAPPPATVQ